MWVTRPLAGESLAVVLLNSDLLMRISCLPRPGKPVEWLWFAEAPRHKDSVRGLEKCRNFNGIPKNKKKIRRSL